MKTLVDLHEDAIYHLNKIKKFENKIFLIEVKKQEAQFYSDIEYNDDIKYVKKQIHNQKEKYLKILNIITSFDLDSERK
jgi:hypothetical protein